MHVPLARTWIDIPGVSSRIWCLENAFPAALPLPSTCCRHGWRALGAVMGPGARAVPPPLQWYTGAGEARWLCFGDRKDWDTPVAHSRVAAFRKILPQDFPRMAHLFLRAERFSPFSLPSLSLSFFFCASLTGWLHSLKRRGVWGCGAAHLLRLSNSAASAKDLEMCVARRRHISTPFLARLFSGRARLGRVQRTSLLVQHQFWLQV